MTVRFSLAACGATGRAAVAGAAAAVGVALVFDVVPEASARPHPVSAHSPPNETKATSKK
jgi:hypothetical protein